MVRVGFSEKTVYSAASCSKQYEDRQNERTKDQCHVQGAGFVAQFKLSNAGPNNNAPECFIDTPDINLVAVSKCTPVWIPGIRQNEDRGTIRLDPGLDDRVLNGFEEYR